jgi:hypothetical protein
VPTAGDLITEASAQLHGWGSTQDRVTPLAADLNATDLSFTVSYAFGQSVGIAPGVVEIDSELLYVVSVDQASGQSRWPPASAAASVEARRLHTSPAPWSSPDRSSLASG